jgi:Asp/Glu/hydantoin racemase
MKILLLNANTTASITELMLREGRALAPDLELVGATAGFGVPYIGTRAGAAIAAHAALDVLAAEIGAANSNGYAAVALGCFGDPGLAALRELSPVPVAGMAEASMLAACQLGGRVALVTGGARWVPMLEEFVASIGLASRLAAVRAVPLTGAEIAAAPARALDLLADVARHAVAEDGAEVVVLGGAGLAGLAAKLQDRVDVPLLDSLACLLVQARALAAGDAARPAAGSYAPPPPIDAIALSPALTSLLKQKN